MPALKTRHDIINTFIAERNYSSFLEIGTGTGESLKLVRTQTFVSVDPDPHTPATDHVTSDAFFDACSDSFDIILIDGLHEHNQVYRDIKNSLEHLNPGGVIILHDCLPTTEYMQRTLYESQYGYAWTGDVWKAFTKARAELPYLMYTIDTDFGCGIIDTRFPLEPQELPELPTDMEAMNYDHFINYRNEFMNVKEGIYHGKQ